MYIILSIISLTLKPVMDGQIVRPYGMSTRPNSNVIITDGEYVLVNMVRRGESRIFG